MMRKLDLGDLLILMLVAASLFGGCSETPTEPTPAPAPVVTPAPPAPAPAPVVVVEPFCPYEAITLNASFLPNGNVQYTFEPRFSKDGQYLKRYQVRLERYGAANEFSEYGFQELEVERLSGPHNRRAVIEKAGLIDGRYKAQIRVHFPNECRDDGHGNDRANGEWSPLTESFSK